MGIMDYGNKLSVGVVRTTSKTFKRKCFLKNALTALRDISSQFLLVRCLFRYVMSF